MRRILHSLGLLAVFLPALLAQEKGEKAEYPFPGIPLPSGACSSQVKVATDPALLVGEFHLSTKRAPIVDGDTIRVDGLKSSLRLLGIDTEETFKDPKLHDLARKDWDEYLHQIYAGTKKSRPPKFGTPMGEAAKDFAKRFFKGVETVRLEYDHPRRRRGYFGRHLVHVLVNKGGRWINFNIEIVRQGLSPYFTKYGACHRFDAAFREALASARKGGLGLWAKPRPYRGYPDYELRERWWHERELDIAHLESLRKTRKDLFILGEKTEWKRLRKAEGQKVWVCGTPGRLRQVRTLGLQALGHRRGSDFMIAGPFQKVKELGLEAQEGNLIMVQGVVSLHRKNPQFRLETVTAWKRIPRTAATRDL